MLSEKKKRSDLGLHIFLRNSWRSLKKKRSSLPFTLSFPYFCPKTRVFSKKKKVFTQNRSLNKHLHRIETVCAIFEGAPKKMGAWGNCLICLTQYPPLIIAFFYHSNVVILKVQGLIVNDTQKGKVTQLLICFVCPKSYLQK